MDHPCRSADALHYLALLKDCLHRPGTRTVTMQARQFVAVNAADHEKQV